MPVYTYKHTCGFSQRVFLQEDKETVIAPCYNCGRNVSMRQVRDKSKKIAGDNWVTGIMDRDKSK